MVFIDIVLLFIVACCFFVPMVCLSFTFSKLSKSEATDREYVVYEIHNDKLFEAIKYQKPGFIPQETMRLFPGKLKVLGIKCCAAISIIPVVLFHTFLQFKEATGKFFWREYFKQLKERSNEGIEEWRNTQGLYPSNEILLRPAQIRVDSLLIPASFTPDTPQENLVRPSNL